MMNSLDLIQMARRGEEDGHDRAWYSQFAPTPRALAMMHQAADEARAAIERSEIITYRQSQKALLEKL